MIQDQLKAYKRKYYINLLIKGTILSGCLLVGGFYVFNFVEYIGKFNSLFRGLLFYSYVGLACSIFYLWILAPLFKLSVSKSQISDTEAAVLIGDFFPQIKDKLLNTLQLYSLSASSKSDLVQASLLTRENHIGVLQFTDAIDLASNRKYLRYLLPILFVFFGTLFLLPEMITETTPRIVYYNRTFNTAPFSFVIQNTLLKAYRNEDFELNVVMEGKAIPAQVFIRTEEGRRHSLDKKSADQFSFIFNKLQKNTTFYLEASGYSSEKYSLQVVARPNLKDFTVYLDYPEYTKRQDERLDNTGNLIIPGGTTVKWDFDALHTDSLKIIFPNLPIIAEYAVAQSEFSFGFSKEAAFSTSYQIELVNEHGKNKDLIEYQISVIPDEYPQISASAFHDTVLYDFLVIGGNIGDDYGISALSLHVRVSDDGVNANSSFKPLAIPFNQQAVNQSYFYKLSLSEMGLQTGQKVEYYIEVWDNDGVNGRKRTKTNSFEFRIPSDKELEAKIEQQTNDAESQMDKAHEKSKEIEQQVKELQDRLKGKKKLDWQDKKAVEELMEKNDDIQKDIEQLNKMNQLLNEKQEKFGNTNEKIAEKAEQLQKLMDELLDEETKKLYEQLNELLQQNFINKDFQDVLDKLQQKQGNLEKELDRALELFKKLKADLKAQELVNDLKKMAEEQQKVGEEVEQNQKENQTQEQAEQLEKEQEKLNEEFKEFEEEFKEYEKLNDQLSSPKELDDLQRQEQQIKREMENSSKQMKEKEMKKASDSQKKSSKQMKEMAQKMEEMQQSTDMEEMQENYEDLRQIMENLITLSFDQEKLMLEYRSVKRIDPKFVKLGQQQLKLKDDAQVVEDSLLALSKRVFQIESFVTREVTEMNKNIDESLDAIRKRIPEIASGKQQLAMTSINNLALLLNDIMEQMQNQIGQGMSGKQNNEKKSGSPSLSDLQKQLNQQIQDVQKSGKSGQQLSEELAKLAAEQEMIRNALQQSGQQQGKEKGEKEGGEQDGGSEKDGGSYGKILDQMEKTEEDLVNKRITQETIQRQKEILTRLLESEKADKERELDDKREAEAAKEKEHVQAPDEFEKYLKSKEAQIELLKTLPPYLNPYYKKEVNEYFKKIKN